VATGQDQMTGSAITAANLLTLMRLILLPVVIVGIATERSYLAAAPMAAMVVTDLLDGRMARRLGQASEFGKALDSTVDFVMIYSLFIAFYAAGRLATWQFSVLYLAMLTILLLQMFSAGREQRGAPARTALGKVTGALQYGYLLFLVVLEVLPRSAALAAASLVFFLVLAAAIALHSIECLVALRRVT